MPKKDAQLLIKLDKDMKKEFNALCEKLDTSASREVRHFIREFIKSNNAKK